MNQYLVLRLNNKQPSQRMANKIICMPEQLLNKLNELTDFSGEYAYESISDIIDGNTDENSSMTIIDLDTLGFIDYNLPSN
jgi:hypothetical protein